MAGTKDYSANEVDLIIGVIKIDSGFADGPFLRITPEADDYDDEAGADGEVVRSKSNDKRADVQVILQQTSAGNNALRAMRAAGLLIPNGGGIVPILVRDKNSGSALWTGEHCWIKRRPNAEFGKVAGTREWTIRVASLDEVPDPSAGALSFP